MSARQVPTYCRVCLTCPILVTVADLRVTDIAGDKQNPVWRGHTCVKGRKQHARLYGRERLLRSQKRLDDGAYAPIASGDAMDEIAERLGTLVERYGPNSIAYYQGTATTISVLTNPIGRAFVD
jgi:anaerobic selenocysteine-containing dehydrogenase